MCRPRLRRLAGLAVPLAIAACAGLAHAEGPASGSWKFRVLLDGEPIGEHRFTLTSQGARRELRSVARFDVKLLGLTVYRYRHEATEHWQGDCLVDLSSTTDDDGKVSSVQARQEGPALSVTSPEGTEKLGGCVMSFAYWHPAMLEQSRLLNPQTGAYEQVGVRALGTSVLPGEGDGGGGGGGKALHYRVTGPAEPLELWYSLRGDWLRLESTVSGGKRRLAYERE